MRIGHRKGSTRVRNGLPPHEVTVIIFATFKLYYGHFTDSAKLLYSGNLSKIF